MREAAGKIPDEVCARFESADKLSDADRELIVEIARRSLEWGGALKPDDLIVTIGATETFTVTGNIRIGLDYTNNYANILLTGAGAFAFDLPL